MLFIGFMSILKTKNKNNEALIWAAYVVGSEVLFRMSKGLLFYEFPKYMVFLFLLTGMIVEKKQHNLSPVFIYYILLLLVGISFTNIPFNESIRTNVIFNLSGPILLGLSALYTYKRKITLENLFKMLKYLGLPIISMAVYIYLKAPDAQYINFGGVSSRTASGGYGPNQVATALGIGMFVFAVYLILKKRISGYFWVDMCILIFISYRALITLSRGGVITAVVAILAFAFFYFLSKNDSIFHFIKFTGLVVAMSIPLFIYTSIKSDGMLINRYTNKNQRGVDKEDMSAGRFEIMENEFKGFLENPFFGIGVGSGKFKRIDELGYKVASHNEMSRLIGEHGAIGLLLLFVLMFVPVSNMKRQPFISIGLLSSFWFFWFLTINHSAMRLAMPAFMYGLCLLNITNPTVVEVKESAKE